MIADYVPHTAREDRWARWEESMRAGCLAFPMLEPVWAGRVYNAGFRSVADVNARPAAALCSVEMIGPVKAVALRERILTGGIHPQNLRHRIMCHLPLPEEA